MFTLIVSIDSSHRRSGQTLSNAWKDIFRILTPHLEKCYTICPTDEDGMQIQCKDFADADMLAVKLKSVGSVIMRREY